MRLIWKSLAACLAGTCLLFSAQVDAQDQGDFIRRMDTNGNGMIDPEESQGRARGMLERMAQSNPRINLSRPIPVEMLSREMERVRGGSGGGANGGRGGGAGGPGGGMQGGGFQGGFGGGGFGGGGSFGGGPNGNEQRSGGRNSRQNGVDAAGNPVPTLLEGFGNEYNDSPVLGFGSDQEANLTGIKLTDDDTGRMERTLRQNDRNNDGVIEGEEISKGRWDDGDPKQYDSNRDGRLSKNELLIRAAKKRVADEAAEKADREQRNRERDQRGGGGDRGGDRGGERGGGRFGGMFGGGMGGGGWPGGGGFGGGGFGGGGGWQGGGGGWQGAGGGFGGGGFGGGGPGGMRFGPPGGDPNAMGGGPGGNIVVTMGAPGGDGGRGGGGRGDRGNGGQGDNNEPGRGGPGGPPGFGGGGPGGGGPGFGGGGLGGGDFGGGGGGFGRGRGGDRGGDNGDPTARIEGFFNDLDKNQSGSLEKEEWEGLRMVRGEDLDKDSSGAISKQEYMEIVGKRMGIEVDPAKYAWRPSGPLTYRAKDMKEKNPEVPAWFWNEDKNGDGQISMAERSTNWTDERLARWMKEDTNGDGMVSMKEAVASLKPAATGLVIIAPKTTESAANKDQNAVAAAPAGDPNDRGEGNRSRNTRNSQTGPRIDVEEAKEMKADRSQRWNNATSGAKVGSTAPVAAGELPTDLPKDIDKAFAEKSANYFSQKLDTDPKDGVLSGKEMDDFKDADTNKDGKVNLTEYIVFKKG